MAETLSLTAKLSVDNSDYLKGVKAAIEAQAELAGETEKASKGIFGQMTAANLASKAIAKAFQAITGAIGDAVKRVDTLNNYPKVMESLGYSSAEAEKSINALSDGIEGLPTTLDSIVSSSQRLTASLGDMQAGTKTAIALNDLFLAGGGGAEAAARGLEQYNQMLAAGKVDMQSWKTLLEVAPGQMNQLAQSMLGATANQKNLYSALQEGTITMGDLNAKVIQLDQEGGESFASFAEQARAATGGIGTAWKNIQTAVVKGVAKVIDEFDKGAKAASGGGIADGFNKVKKVISDVFNVVAKVAGFIGKHFETIIKIIGLAVGAFATFKIITNVQKWVKNLGSGLTQLIARITGSAVASGADAAAKTAEAGATAAATGAQQGLNAALTANPIGTVIQLITAAVSALMIFADVLKSDATRELEAFNGACKDTIEASRSVREEGQKSAESFAAQAAANDVLINELEDLINAQDKHGSNTDQIRAKVATLNAAVEDLNLVYDEEHKQLNMSISLLKKKAKAIEAQAKARAEEQRLVDLYKQQSELQGKINKITKEYGINLDLAREITSGVVGAGRDFVSTVTGQGAAVNDLCKNLVALDDELTAVDEAISEVGQSAAHTMQETTAIEATEAQKQAEIQAQSAQRRAQALANAMELEQAALAAALNNGTATMDMLSEKNQETANKLRDTWQTYKDAATNIFDQLSAESELSVDKMIENLRKNQEVISQMGDNMASLRDRFAGLGLDMAILDQFSDMGPEAAGYIANLASASDEQLQNLANTYGQGGELAWDRFTQGLGGEADAAAEQVRSAVTNIGDSLREEVAAANWNELGSDVIKGLAEGLQMDEEAIAAAKKLGIDVEKGTRVALASNSPSKKFESIGKDTITGLTQGLNALKTRPVTILRTMVSDMLQVIRGQVGTFETLGRNAGNGFANGLESTRSRIINTAQSIANSVTQTIKRALDEHSPSKVLEKLGAYAGQGFAIGLAKTEALVERVSGSIADTVANAVAAPNGLSYSAAFAGGGSLEMQSLRAEIKELREAILAQPIQVTSEFDVDGREMAKGTATYMRDELNHQDTLLNNLRGMR